MLSGTPKWPAIIRAAESLRQATGKSHFQFARALGRHKSEWANLRAGRRQPSDGFVRSLRAYASEVGGVWPSRVDVAIQEDALARVA